MGAACCGGSAVKSSLEDTGEVVKVVPPTESSRDALIRAGSSGLYAGVKHIKCERQQDPRDSASCGERRVKYFNAAAVPASPSLSRKTAVPFVSEGSNAGSIALSSRSNSVGSGGGSLHISGVFCEAGNSPTRRGLKISWNEVKEVAVYQGPA